MGLGRSWLHIRQHAGCRKLLVIISHGVSLLFCRYMLNWVKLRAWEQVQWDGIIMIDVDVTVLGDLTHLFHLPTDFAAVPDNGKVWNRYVLYCSQKYASWWST